MSQVDQLLALLRERGAEGVTPLDALEHVGSFRLAARVNDLRKAGYDVRTQIVRTSKGKSIACYTLAEKPEQLEIRL